MNINKFNYEVYALDYLEGNLSQDKAAEMEHFLKTNPTIEAELLGMMELPTLEADTSIKYEFKKELLKSEKSGNIAFLSQQWVRPLLAAASIALLISVFFLGYQAGQVSNRSQLVNVTDENPHQYNTTVLEKNIETLAKAAIPKTVKEENVSSPIVEKTKAISRPLFTAPQLVKEVQIVPEKVNQSAEKLDEAVVKIAQNAEQELPKLDNLPTLPKREQLVMTLLKVEIPSVKSTNKALDNLENTLAAENLPMDKEILASYIKKKRSIKDLLGHFPIHNLKDALIPTYYKDEVGGE